MHIFHFKILIGKENKYFRFITGRWLLSFLSTKSRLLINFLGSKFIWWIAPFFANIPRISEFINNLFEEAYVEFEYQRWSFLAKIVDVRLSSKFPLLFTIYPRWFGTLHKKWSFSLRKLRNWSHSLKKSLTENFIFCAVGAEFKKSVWNCI